MIFIDNKYTRIYFKIIDRAKQRDCIDYVESHHIIPKSFFKSKSKTGWLSGDSESISNKVCLTPREHFLCHVLLIKMTDGIGRWKMSFALKRFVYAKNHKNRITSRTYDYIRKINIDQMKGKSPSVETREKIRQGNLNRAPASKETRRKLSEAAKRRKGFTEEGRKRVVESNKSRVWTEESKQKLREYNLGKPNTAQKGIPQLKLTCPHCGLIGGTSAMKHWHFDKCKSINIVKDNI